LAVTLFKGFSSSFVTGRIIDEVVEVGTVCSDRRGEALPGKIGCGIVPSIFLKRALRGGPFSADDLAKL
jgi:hypothetical protein